MASKSFKDFDFNVNTIKNATPRISKDDLIKGLNAKIIFGENEKGFKGNVVTNNFAKLQYFKEEVGTITLELDTKKTLPKLWQLMEEMNKLQKNKKHVSVNEVAALIIERDIKRIKPSQLIKQSNLENAAI